MQTLAAFCENEAWQRKALNAETHGNIQAPLEP